MRMPQLALLYIQKCRELIRKGDIRFVPTWGRPPRFSEDLHEILAALSQTIYWANYLYLVCGCPEPRATTELETQFWQDVQVGKVIPALRLKLITYSSNIIRSFSVSVH